MITNLPLLFVNGYPTSLAKMTIQDLETFIPFLVHCSWGHDTAKSIQRPNWWPSNVPYAVPIVKPKVLPKDWAARLRELVNLCYKHHGSEFLLKFCDDLTKYPLSSLNFVRNCDSTTSLYLKTSNRLLVTFRNENMLYDKKSTVANRKCLLPERQGANTFVEQEPEANIYLCDTCDDVFYSLEDLKQHELTCAVKKSPSPSRPSTPEVNFLENNDQSGFLGLLGLNAAATNNTVPVVEKTETPKKLIVTRERRSVSLNGLTNFPFSSPAGLRTGKAKFKGSEINTRQREQVERYCSTSSFSENLRWQAKNNLRTFPTRYKKTDDYWERRVVFPYQRGKVVLDLNSQLNFLKCRPCRVVLDRLSPEEVIKQTSKSVKPEVVELAVETDNDIEFISCVQIPEMDRNEIIGKRKLSVKSAENEECPVKTEAKTDEPLAVIDLCSDEDDDQNENVHPSTAYPAASDIVSHSLVLAATPEYLEPLNTNTELEGAQYRIKDCNLHCGKPHLPNVQGHSRLKPLQQCQDNLLSSHVNNVISLD